MDLEQQMGGHLAVFLLLATVLVIKNFITDRATIAKERQADPVIVPFRQPRDGKNRNKGEKIMKKIMVIAIAMIALFGSKVNAQSYFVGDIRYEVPGGQSVAIIHQMCTSRIFSDQYGRVEIQFSLATEGCQGNVFRFGFTEDNRIVLEVRLQSSGKDAYILSRYASKSLRDQAEYRRINHNQFAIDAHVGRVEEGVGRVEDITTATATRDQRVAACKKAVYDNYTSALNRPTNWDMVNTGIDLLCKGDCTKSKALTELQAERLKERREEALIECDAMQ
uniref:Uncharacterized protein n=1 Tax=candidate division CPR3 bacterium TaxID=2268181 RepID=A0A7C4R3Y3_UNCC3